MTCLSSHTVRNRQASSPAVCLSGRCSFCHPRLQPQRVRQDQGGGGFTRGETLHFFPGKKIFFLNHHIFVHTVLFIEQGLCVQGPVVTKSLRWWDARLKGKCLP